MDSEIQLRSCVRSSQIRAISITSTPEMLSRLSNHLALIAVVSCSMGRASLQAEGTNGVQTETVGSADALAKQLANPVAALISVPFQNNFDFGIGPKDGWRYTLNVQPVVPFSLNDDWNLISRTIVPVIHQQDVFGSTSQTGLGDTVQSLFFSPKEPTSGGWTWGIGPVFLLPTATDGRLGSEKWGLGPTGVALKQEGKWTYGVLANHLWSVTGHSDRAEVNATFLQPFVTYSLGQGQTITAQTETTYDWRNSKWTVPLGLFYGKVTRIGSQMVSIGGGVRYYGTKPDGAPDWGLRVSLTLLFPK